MINKLELSGTLTRSEWTALIRGRSPDTAACLFERARAIRHKYYGHDVYIRGLIEFTNYCKNDCYYCGIRKSNRNVRRYRLTKEQILSCCKNGYELGFRTFVLQGGEDGYYTDHVLADIVRTIRSADRVHIGIFGRRNAGKSSVINAITGQNLAIVSAIRGTTTDPVLKTMELLPLGPVVLIDTPGLDDEGELGQLRIQKAYQILNKTDIAVLVADASVGVTKEDYKILNLIQKKKLPYVVVLNKADLITTDKLCPSAHSIMEAAGDSTACENAEANACLRSIPPENILSVSAVTGQNIYELKELLARQIPSEDSRLRMVGDLIKPNDFVVLVVPIDSAAPKGRLILPQQQTIRDVLEAGASAIVVKETELKGTLEHLGKKPALA